MRKDGSVNALVNVTTGQPLSLRVNKKAGSCDQHATVGRLATAPASIAGRMSGGSRQHFGIPGGAICS